MRLNSNEAQEDAFLRSVSLMNLLANIRQTSSTLQAVMGIDLGSKLLGHTVVRVWELPEKARSWIDIVKDLHDNEKSDHEREEMALATYMDQGTKPTVRVRSADEMGGWHAPREQERVETTPRRTLTRAMRNLEESPVRPAVRDIGLPESSIVKAGDGQPPEKIVDSSGGKGGVQGQKRKLQESHGLGASPTINPLAPAKVARSEREEEQEQCPFRIIVTDADDPSEFHDAFKQFPARAALPPPPAEFPLFPPIPASTVPPASPPFNFSKLLEPSKQECLPIYWD